MYSKLLISTKLTKQNATQIDDCFVSPPFKLHTLPTHREGWQNALNVIQMSSSPGILSGDELDIQISLAEKTTLSLSTQAFTRVQSMNIDAFASQNTKIYLASSSRLFYLPHPLVLHKDSAFKQKTLIEMEDNSELIYGEIVAIGRVLNGEKFEFRFFSSYLRITNGENILLSDRIQWHPNKMSLTSLSQMETFSHQGMLLYINLSLTEIEIKNIVQDLQECYNITNSFLIGISQLNEAGLMIRVLANRADVIENLFYEIATNLQK